MRCGSLYFSVASEMGLDSPSVETVQAETTATKPLRHDLGTFFKPGIDTTVPATFTDGITTRWGLPTIYNNELTYKIYCINTVGSSGEVDIKSLVKIGGTDSTTLGADIQQAISREQTVTEEGGKTKGITWGPIPHIVKTDQTIGVYTDTVVECQKATVYYWNLNDDGFVDGPKQNVIYEARGNGVSGTVVDVR